MIYESLFCHVNNDNNVVICISKEKQNNKNNITLSKREFTEHNISKFNKILSKEDWKTVYYYILTCYKLNYFPRLLSFRFYSVLHLSFFNTSLYLLMMCSVYILCGGGLCIFCK